MPLHLTEARVRAELLSDVATTVHLDLTSPEHFDVEATLTFACREPGASTFLELRNAQSVSVDGENAEYADGRIALRDLAATNEVTVNARLPYVTDGNGMTVTVDPADGERYVCAYTAMDIAQNVVPCFDQPDLKSTFTVSVTAPEHWTVLANGLLRERVDGPDAPTWHFERTPAISTYLFFVAGGPWVSMTWDEPYASPHDQAPGGTLPFGWHARASQAAELERDFHELKRITSACFQHFTRVFEPPYPFADYQQAFSPGLNWSAMEFPGCVAFRDEMLTQGTPTAIERLDVAAVIAHEMTHMWFGDLVTMRWWEDSWLNESFADFMGYDVAGVAAGYPDSWVNAALTRKPTGYRADLRRSTHPVAEDAESVPDPDTAFANFDMITYAKGNALLRQLGFWLGADFLRGVNGYLSAHGFDNATLADFLDALDAASDRDVRAWAQGWLRSTGFDTIAVTREGDVPVLTRHGTRPHRFSVGAFDADMGLVGSVVVDLADDPVSLPDFAGFAVVPNLGDETFAGLRLDPQTREAVISGLSNVTDPLQRGLLWWTTVGQVESGELGLDTIARLADEHLRRERHPVVFEGASHLLLGVARRYATPDALPHLLDRISDAVRAVLDTDDPALAPGAPRTLAGICGDANYLRRWLDLPDVDQEVRWAAVRRLAELGDISPTEAEASRDRSVAGRLATLAAQAAVPTAAAKDGSWEVLMSGTLTSHEFSAVARGFWGWEQAELVEPYLERYLGDGLDLAQRSGQAMSDVIGRAFPWLPLSDPVRRALRSALVDVLARDDVPTVLARAWNDHLDDLDRVLG